MATSSITHNFVVSDVERFVDAVEKSEMAVNSMHKPSNNRSTVVDDPERIRKNWAKVVASNGIRR